MSLFSRLSYIINANLNAILDEAEDPTKMVRMITHEMEATLVEVRSTSLRYIADRNQIVKKIDWLRTESRAWEHKAALAAAKGRDGLARAALTEKTRQDDTVARLNTELEGTDATIAKLKQDTSQLEDTLRVARSRQKALILLGQTAQSRIKVKRQISATAYANTLDRFERYECKLNEMEGEIESGDPGNQPMVNEINDLENSERLERELEVLKARLAKSTELLASQTRGES